MTNEELKQIVEDLKQKIEALSNEYKQIKKQIKENEESNKEKDLNFFEWYDNDIHRTHLFDYANSETTNEIYDYSCFNSPKERAKEYKHFLARRILKYEAKKLNDGWTPDYNKDGDEEKCIIVYDYINKLYSSINVSSLKIIDICLKNKYLVSKLIKKCVNYTEKKYPILDWYFGIEK